ncbi:MAG TPA: hypothetical protein VFL77_11840 [Solirubrobacterales bacterium]|nr:hypothetical protein [Solirubrobacterales bacterium]
MSILDDAIREHLELKRAHGADEAELKKLEDEAFGPPGRPEEPDPFAEAPTEFMATEAPEVDSEGEGAGPRRINVADLQEPPPPEPTATAPAEDSLQAASPAEEPPVVEAEAAPPVDVEPASAEEAEAPSAEDERPAIADQPTQFFDVEAELEDEEAPAVEAPSPSDEEIVEIELSEPKIILAEPATEIHASRAEAPAEPLDEEDEEDEEFWSEQRLSDELDQALESPPAEEQELPPLTGEDEEGEDEPLNPDYDPDTGHEDVLEDTPDFLEDAPEDDELWFEQKPPKDFDFDD